MMKKMTKKNEKYGYFIQMMKKNDDQNKKYRFFIRKLSKKNDHQTLRPRPTEVDGEIFAGISDKK